MSSEAFGTQKLSRRSMLRLSAMTAAGVALLAACAPAAQAPAAGGGAAAARMPPSP